MTNLTERQHQMLEAIYEKGDPYLKRDSLMGWVRVTHMGGAGARTLERLMEGRYVTRYNKHDDREYGIKSRQLTAKGATALRDWLGRKDERFEPLTAKIAGLEQFELDVARKREADRLKARQEAKDNAERFAQRRREKAHAILAEFDLAVPDERLDDLIERMAAL